MAFSHLDRLKSGKYRFHYLGMPHLPVSKKYSPCAFTQKILNLTKILLSQGHEVFLYGAGYTDLEHENLTFIPLITVDDLRKEYGVGDNRFELGYDWKEEQFKHDINTQRNKTSEKFVQGAIAEINKRKEPSDFFLNPQGWYYKDVADAVDLYLTCEPGVGYRGSYSRFRAFESTYIQNFTYGSEHPRESISGSFYDRVIPNYYDLTDFPYDTSIKKDNYLLFMGRVTTGKGVKTAIQVAEALDKEILIVGQGSLHDINYPYKKATHLSAVGSAERFSLMARAQVTLTPSVFLEPFCGVSIESMLSGTPVVASNFGAFTDTIMNGVNGFKCDTLDDFVKRTKLAMELDEIIVHDFAASMYSLEEVGKLYQKWFDELYRVYLSLSDPSIKAWHYIAD